VTGSSLSVESRPTSVVVALVILLGVPLAVAIGEAADPLFKTPFRGYPTGRRPLDIVQGDLNRDGAPDLVVANFGSASVSLLLNDGTGAFGTRTDVATGPRPRALALEDLDRDGRQELLVADSEQDVLRIYHVTSLGGVEPWFTLDTPAEPSDVIAHDLSGDGFPEIVVACAAAGMISVFPNQEKDGFPARIDYPTLAGARFVGHGEFTYEGQEDLVVAGDPGHLEVFRGLGGGRFKSHSKPGGGVGTPLGIDVVDLNRDSFDDVVIFGTSGVAARFDPANVSETPTRLIDAPSIRWAGLGDIDGDGRLDVLVNDGPTPYGRVSVYRGQSTVPYARSWDGLAGGFPLSGVVVDVNGDRRPDLALANSTSHNVSVLTNLLQSRPSEHAINVGSSPQHMNTADWNRDGHPDLLVHTIFPGSHSDPWPSSAVYRVERSGTVVTRGVFFSEACCLDNFLAADVSSDNVIDLVYMRSSTRELFVRFSNSPAGPTVSRRVAEAVLPPLAVGDFDDDGHADILFQRTNPLGIGVLRGIGNRMFERGADIPLSGGIGQMLPGDFDGDGWADLAVAHHDGVINTVSILRNLHTGVLRPLPVGPAHTPMTIGDFDGNGTLDLSSASGLTYLGYGDFTFRSVFDPVVPALERNAPSGGDEDPLFSGGLIAADATSREVASRTNTVAAGDFNGDGFDDIAFMGYGYNSIHVRLSLDGGRFGPPMEYGTGRLPLSLAAGDFNVDGRDDIATVTFESGLVILLNTGATVVPVSWLTSRLARVADGGVVLSWDVPADARASAFSVLRSVNGGERERLTPRPVSGLARHEFLDDVPPAGRLRYWIEELTRTGAVETHGPFDLQEGDAAPGTRPVLHAVHPNPFRGTTSLAFTLAEGGPATLTVHDVAGRRVATLLDGVLPSGRHSATWEGVGDAGAPLPSGIYFLRLETAVGAVTRKVVRTR
jgi:hypothetical protein